jgi:hypothetical protein
VTFFSCDIHIPQSLSRYIKIFMFQSCLELKKHLNVFVQLILFLDTIEDVQRFLNPHEMSCRGHRFWESSMNYSLK